MTFYISVEQSSTFRYSFFFLDQNLFLLFGSPNLPDRLPTFSKSLNFTSKKIRRPSGGVFSLYKWSKRSNNYYYNGAAGENFEVFTGLSCFFLCFFAFLTRFPIYFGASRLNFLFLTGFSEIPALRADVLLFRIFSYFFSEFRRKKTIHSVTLQ